MHEADGKVIYHATSNAGRNGKRGAQYSMSTSFIEAERVIVARTLKLVAQTLPLLPYKTWDHSCVSPNNFEKTENVGSVVLRENMT